MKKTICAFLPILLLLFHFNSVSGQTAQTVEAPIIVLSDGSSIKMTSVLPLVKNEIKLFSSACPTPVWSTPSKTVNCNSPCITLKVGDSASLAPQGYMTPGYGFFIKFDGNQCTENRLELYSAGKLVAAIGPTAGNCGTGCTYLGNWSAVAPCDSTAPPMGLSSEFIGPSYAFEFRFYDAANTGSFPYIFIDHATGDTTKSGTWTFPADSSGRFTTGVLTKADSVIKGTAKFTCASCPVNSVGDGKNGFAQFCPANNVKPGKYEFTYTFDNWRDCINGFSDTITVNAIYNASWKSPDTVCINSTHNLSSYLDSNASAGGVWSGAGVTGTTFKPTVAGLTNVLYKLSAGTSCEAKVAHNIFVSKTGACSPTGIDHYKDNDITIFPNPASTSFEIELNKNVVREISVVNIIGETVWQQGKIIGSKLLVDARQLSPGIYFVCISTLENKIVKRINITR